MTEPQVGGTYDELRVLALWAEEAGFDAFSRSDHYMDRERSAPATDALTTLAALAADTTTIKLNVLVSPVAFRHPGTLAKTAATIDEISRGRFELGMGTGWMESEHERFGYHFPDWAERFERLEEMLVVVGAAFGRRSGGFTGDHFAIADVEVLPAPTGPLPIVVGGGGPKKTPALAGRYGDELNMFSLPLAEIATRRDVMRAAAEEAGRDPDSIKLSVVGYPVIGDDRADYRDRLGARAAARGMSPEDLEALLESRNLPHGTTDEARAAMAAIEAAGVSRYYLQVYAPLNEIDTDDVGRAKRLLSA